MLDARRSETGLPASSSRRRAHHRRTPATSRRPGKGFRRPDAEATFGDLHHAIQDACGWDDDHLFVFRTPTGGVIGGSPFEDAFGDRVPDAGEVGLAGYFAQHERCQYEYDFGDSWLHDIEVVRRVDKPVAYRRQLRDEARAFPPQDCGGLPGYHQCVEVATGHGDHEGRREWLGDWDPEYFDLTQLKRRFDG